jgi:glycosyltransferase involved in cell wall biosynthesis
MNTPELSVIVPARDAAQFIGQTLESIRGQKFENWGCIVVDDGSCDHTPAVVRRTVEKDSRFTLIQQSCGGLSLARNRGFLESIPASKYVTFMDAADIWEPNALAILVERLELHPEAVGAHGLAELIDREGRPVNPGTLSAQGRRRLGYRNGRIQEWPASEATVFETLVWTDSLFAPGLLVARRTAFEKAGIYDQGLQECEHWDMALRLSRLGPIEFLDQVLLYHRRCVVSGFAMRNSGSWGVRRLHRKIFSSRENTLQQQLILKEGWRAWQRFKIEEKWGKAVASCLRGAPLEGLNAGWQLPLHAMKYVCGSPALLGI